MCRPARIGRCRGIARCRPTRPRSNFGHRGDTPMFNQIRCGIAAMLAVAILSFAGCTVTKDDKKATTLGIPEGSVQVDESKDRLNWDAKQAGTVYVYDVDQDRLVYQHHVQPGDRI